MTTITINIDNPAIIPSLKKVLSALDGVTIARQTKTRKTGMEKALDDKKAGRVVKCKNKEELFEQLGL